MGENQLGYSVRKLTQTAGVPSPLVEARVNAQHAPVAQLTYTQSDGGASVSISIMQGTAAEMQTLLAHSRHTWTVATPTTVNANGRWSAHRRLP